MRHVSSARLLALWLCVATTVPVLAASTPTYVEVYNPAGIRQDGSYVDKLLMQIMKETKTKGPQLAGSFPEGRTERVKVQKDAQAEIGELFYRRGWTDGLPIVIPTAGRVREMLRGSDLGPDTVIGVLDPMEGVATVEKIAVNAVMAGCKPEHMPVLIAAVESLSDPATGLKSLATTTSPDAPLLILTGPIIRDLDLNAGGNSMGRGRQANASIGRAVQMLINNVGGSWPGVTDMSTLGNPAEYSWVLTENAALNPWTSLNADFGWPQSASVATVVGAEGIRGMIAMGRSSEDFLKLVASHAEGMVAQRPYWPVAVLIIASDTAAQLKRDGWDKDSIRAAILKLCNESRAAGDRKPSPGTSGAPRFSIEHFLILVAGGTGEKSMLIPGFFGASRPVSKEIRVPESWKPAAK